MANEFRVKEGLIVDGVSGSGVNPVQISDAVISSASALEVRSTANANPAILIHANAGSDETIKIHSNQGTGTDSIILLSDDGGIDVDAAKAISLTTTGAAGDISLVSAHTAGVAFHIDANANAASEVQIDAGILDIDVTGAATIDTGGALTLTSAANFTIDSNTDIILDANGADITFKDDGTTTHHFFNGGSISKVEFGYDAEVSPIDTAHNIAGKTLEIAGGDTTAGTSDDVAGGTLTLRGGYGKGDAVGGSVILAVASTNGASSGSSLNNTRDAHITISGTNGAITMNDSLAGISMQSAGLLLAPKGGVTGQNSVVDFTLGDASSSAHNADRRILYATSEATFRAALNLDGSGSMSAPIWELGIGGTVTGNTTTALPTQAQYTTASTAFAFGAQGSVYRIGSDNATSGQVLTFDGTEWLAEDVSGTGDVSASSNFGTDNVLIRSDGTSKGVQATGITIADTTNNMSGVGSISSKQIAIAPANDAGVAALLITPIDANQHGIDINSSITTANVLDITADATTTGHVINVSANGLTGTGGFMKMASNSLTIADTGTSALVDMVVTNDSVGSQTAYGMSIDYNKSGITASGKTTVLAGLAVDVDDAAENVGTATIYGGIFTSNSANAGGTVKNVGVYASAGGGDTNYAGEFAGDMLFTSDTATFTSSNANDPLVVIKNTTNDADGAVLRFVKDKGAAGAANDVAGVIEFVADDANQDQVKFSEIKSQVAVHTNGQEGGKLSLGVASHDGEMQYGIVITDGDAEDEIDVTIGSGEGSLVLITGDLQVNGSHTTVNSTVVTIDDLSFNMAADVTASSALTGAGIILGAENYASGSSFSNNPTLLYDHTGTRWEFSAHDVEMPADVYIGDDLSLTSDSAVFNMGAGNDFTITHDGTTGATIAGNPITITAGGASTWSTSAGALTITSAAACTWSAAAGDLTLDSAAGTANLDGHTGVQITSSNSGNIDLDSAAEIVLDAATDGTVKLQDAGNTYAEFAHGSVAIANIEDSAGATVVDTWDASEYTAVKYLLVVEDVTNSNKRMSVEMMVMGDDEPTNSAAYYTTYAVLYDDSEFGSFAAAGRSSSNLIDLKYTPVATGGTVNHKVRVVAQRVASI